MFNKLITLGCSNTFGVGLQDCWPDTSFPSKLGWAKLLANGLNLPLTNLSRPGASNLGILNDIISANITTNDLVFVMWTHMDRSRIVSSTVIEDAGPWVVTENRRRKEYKKKYGKEFFNQVKNYFKYYYTETDSYNNFLMSMHHAQCYLNDKKLNYLFTATGPWLSRVPEFLKKTEYFKQLNIENILTEKYLGRISHNLQDRAQDNNHPGQLSNDIIATYFIKQCQNRLLK
tara:strand:+ start:59 stop:751 length:693 start_codon:yes stop_codon:yes gene_type:complete